MTNIPVLFERPSSGACFGTYRPLIRRLRKGEARRYRNTNALITPNVNKRLQGVIGLLGIFGKFTGVRLMQGKLGGDIRTLAVQVSQAMVGDTEIPLPMANLVLA